MANNLVCPHCNKKNPIHQEHINNLSKSKYELIFDCIYCGNYIIIVIKYQIDIEIIGKMTKQEYDLEHQKTCEAWLKLNDKKTEYD